MSQDHQPAPLKASWLTRTRTMAQVGYRMMFHDKLKLLGTLFGVVFAVILCSQQLGVMFGLVYRNTMFVSQTEADIWIVPPSTETLQGGSGISESALLQARAVDGVMIAEPLLYGGGTISLPTGGAEGITIIGTRWPNLLGGPWNMVQGAPEALTQADTMIFEDSKREQFGGININSLREVNGRQIRVGGFTWGLIAFAPPYSFAELDLARDLLNIKNGQMSYVLIKVRPGQDISAVREAIAERVPEADVLTRQEFSAKITRNLLTGPIGISFATSTLFGLAIGFFIVALSMFSSVLDNLREFGTLKAIGCSNGDLTRLLLTQSVIYALLGSLVGLVLILRLVKTISSAQFFMIVPDWLVALMPGVMVLLCLTAASLALWRIRKLEPGMVFR